MKLWEKGHDTDQMVEKFTVGRDRELDLRLAAYDVKGSLAHAEMLAKTGIISKQEFLKLKKGLLEIQDLILKGKFAIEDQFEDVHSKIEFLLTQRLGETGKKIHAGRSRNDQVLTAIKLYLKDEIREIRSLTEKLCLTLLRLSDKHTEAFLPGYTHFQVAMPSTFGLWLAAYAETFADDLQVLHAGYLVADQNPLGSAAGYGSSFRIDRSMTTRLLGFRTMHYNSLAAQMSRGKTELATSYGIAAIASTLAKLAMDVCLYNSQNFGFISLPDDFTTGSSIMPHKKNPDVAELIRAKCNRLSALPDELHLVLSNLPSGYHRDFQILKESLFPAIEELKICLSVTDRMMKKIKVSSIDSKKDIYKNLFTVEEVGRLVQEGWSFREAYHKVAVSVENNSLHSGKALKHTHEGSTGNLCNDRIREKLKHIHSKFG